MNSVIIGLGSNIRPRENIRLARARLSQKFHVLKKSRIVRTRPIGMTGGYFLNTAVMIQTPLELRALEKRLKIMESELGRDPNHAKDQARTMDLDVLVFNREIVNHDVYKRDFVRRSVLELIPDLPLDDA